MADTKSSTLAAAGSQPINRFELLVKNIPTLYVHTISGGLAGAVSAIVSCPLDLIKTKLQAQGGFKVAGTLGEGIRGAAYHGIKGTARTIWREEGLRGMYRGLSPLLLGYIPTWAVYLTVYNRTQTYLNDRPGGKSASFATNVYASLVGGATSTFITNPVWVIKTRLMSQSNTARAPWHYDNVLDAIRKMYRHEGLRSFYSGLTPAMIGLTHVAVQFPLYEAFKAELTGMKAGVNETAEERAKHFWGLALSVFLSKIIASTATYPHEVVRTRLQTQQRAYTSGAHGSESIRSSDYGRPPGSGSVLKMLQQPRVRGTIETCKIIFAEEGPRGFYAGLGTNLIRAVPSAMTTLLTFEYLKKAIFSAQESARDKEESFF